MPTASEKLQVVRSPNAASRLSAAQAWLRQQGRARELLIVGPNTEAVARIARPLSLALGGCFGWQRLTFTRLAANLAAHAIAHAELALAGPLAIEAVCARLVHELSAAQGLGRFGPIATRPGFARALARTLTELRLALAEPQVVPDPDVSRLLSLFGEELTRLALADRAQVFRLASARLAAGAVLSARPLLLLDVPIASACERELLRALLATQRDVLITVPHGDLETEHNLHALGLGVRDLAPGAAALETLQRGLFSETSAEAQASQVIEVFSAPGESRECVEIARRILREAERGVRFDHMAVLLRTPVSYRAHLEEAFARAEIPAHFARGSQRPNPSGRAFLALLACAAEGLSALRFAEYLSLGEVPDATNSGAAPPAAEAGERWAAPDYDLIGDATSNEEQEAALDRSQLAEPEVVPVIAGNLRAPRAWEQLLVDAAVIGGQGRWERRLQGLRAELELDRRDYDDPSDPGVLRIERDLAALQSLREYALPLLADLDALPAHATWASWLDRLAALATRALRHPDSVLRVLAELAPMGDVGPVELSEVRLVLERRLTDVITPPLARSYGRVFVGTTEEVRGLAFDVVFVPGLAEKMFPQKLVEDPLLSDAARSSAGIGLRTNVERAALERLALRLAIGAATQRVFVSYPRLDLEQSRPRTASFYGLEVLRAAEGVLHGFDELAVRADRAADARIGWPAPQQPSHAIDDAEHDLALLELVLHRPAAETVGSARYLLSANPYLARALRFRWLRWSSKWTAADGVIEPAEPARAALLAHALGSRSFSATALQNFSACPYRFLLQAVHRLAPREEPVAIERLDPLQRGSLIHEVQFELFNQLRAENLLPITSQNLETVRARLDHMIERVAARYKDQLYPAIERIWDDAVASIRADLREWLRRATDDSTWRPKHFELSFGLKARRSHDRQSVDHAVKLDCGIQLRGSIDLVETSASGALRATDHKTGKVRAEDRMVIKGGETLQPVLYALALEKLEPEARVEAGRLYYCTFTGDFKSVSIALDAAAREAAQSVADTIGGAIDKAFVPAAPAHGACKYCDYQRVCGPYEELRTARKKREPLTALKALRDRR